MSHIYFAMKTKLLIISACVLISAINLAQAQKPFKLNQKYSKSVVNSIFYAAQSGDFKHLYGLCDPNGYSDRDAKRICFIAQLADAVSGNKASENARQNLDEFISIFKPGKITGKITFENEGDTEYAKVPIWYDHPLGESRSNETIKLVKRSGKWYLFSF